MAEYTCVYCGLTGDSIDHVPPTSVRATLVEIGLAKRFPSFEVRCCRECNSALGDQPLWTIGARKAFIKMWLRRRYKKYLIIPDWTELELARLGEDMQAFTEQGLGVRDLTRKRLAF